MGYTHYWSVDRNHPSWPEVFGRTALDTATVILPWAEAAGVPLAGWDGEPGTSPEVGEGLISLNGVAPDDCETFHMPALAGPPEWPGQDPDRGFCKTQGRPYDVVVLLVLLRLKAHAEAATVTVTILSDGLARDRQHDRPGWHEARSAYRDLFGTEPPV